ncbi:VIT1/CCC1 transporter family protein [Cellulomonas dongxiuzhuiae]|uniref:VIT1/CCC1 transporter family protein n=1 Tax=Cellulomonas dongxiuzhuiae TaxID=2819979 RepID=A0ABX8GLQ7_9CELL|nr:VIT1/CCC1 transporter family protein [Cellulomonas dongxiuzhuiae]MBO3095796.1 VIT1/CCC1 transporter family protein [Cellulomonas dongxiuzhuiae]QWC17108.1 VIT1/CCC1 transporter family protein [Cellulomonas dongxiuzhuiae]
MTTTSDRVVGFGALLRRTPRRAASNAGLNRLRAGVLGANDGIVSVGATVVGVAGAAASTSTIALAGGAALLAGALSMASGEYVSVSSQRDAERVAAASGRPITDAHQDFTNPWQAALASMLAFTAGALIPLLVVLAPWTTAARVPATFAAVLVALVLTGWASARFTGASHGRSVLRNVLGGSLAMAVTYGVGALVGVAL